MNNQVVVAVSGYFDPLHVGHVEFFQLAKDLGSKLIVIVNNNQQAEMKKGSFFMDEKEFNDNIAANEYIEHAVVHGNLYGTPRSQIDNYLAEDYKVLLEIDWQGAVSVLEQYPNATSIFISPPSIEELRTRLENRGLDSQEVIEKRVEGAKLEMEKAAQFRHQITNISLDIATKNLLNIIFRENHG